MFKLISTPVARATIALAGLACAGAVVAAAAPIGSEHFAPGWQAESHALINRGVARSSTRPMTIWYVPAHLPRGHYLVINRKGDQAEVIDGYSFDIGSDAYHDVRVMLPMGYGYVEALPDRFVPDVAHDAPPAHFEGR
jgi:hypothetical protein